MSQSDVLVRYVCPTLGLIITNSLYLSPMALVLKARRNRHMGSVNPLPFAAMFNTSVGYCIYGCMIPDLFLFFGSFLGAMLGLFYCITSLTIMAKEAVEDEFSPQYLLIEGIVLGSLLVWTVLSIVSTSIFSGFEDPRHQGAEMIGLLCCFWNICFFASPLSTMAEVISKRDASSLYLPTILINCVRATMWMLYGALGVHNAIVWVPNAIGLVLSVFQIFLVVLYHKGRWMEAASGWITQRTILRKVKVQDDEHSRKRTLTIAIVPDPEHEL